MINSSGLINDTGEVSDGTQVDNSDDEQKVYFTITDTNVARGGTKKISVNYYLVYGDEADLPDGVTKSDSDIVNLGTSTEPVYARELEYTTYTTSDDLQDAENLTSGVTYYVKMPYGELAEMIGDEDDATATLWISATTSIWSGSADPKTDSPSGEYTSHKEISVQPVGLFDLD